MYTKQDFIEAYTSGFKECMREYDIDSGYYDANGEPWSNNIPILAEHYVEKEMPLNAQIRASAES